MGRVFAFEWSSDCAAAVFQSREREMTITAGYECLMAVGQTVGRRDDSSKCAPVASQRESVSVGSGERGASMETRGADGQREAREGDPQEMDMSTRSRRRRRVTAAEVVVGKESEKRRKNIIRFASKQDKEAFLLRILSVLSQSVPLVSPSVCMSFLLVSPCDRSCCCREPCVRTTRFATLTLHESQSTIRFAFSLRLATRRLPD